MEIGRLEFLICNKLRTRVLSSSTLSLYPGLTGAIGGSPFHRLGKKYMSVSGSKETMSLKDLYFSSKRIGDEFAY